MSEQSVRVAVKQLVQFMEEALQAMGIPGDDAKIIADVMITSDLWGIASHGIAHLKMYHERIKTGLAASGDTLERCQRHTYHRGG